MPLSKPITRRRFLQKTGALIAGATGLSLLPGCAPKQLFLTLGDGPPILTSTRPEREGIVHPKIKSIAELIAEKRKVPHSQQTFVKKITVAEKSPVKSPYTANKQWSRIYEIYRAWNRNPQKGKASSRFVSSSTK